MNIRPAVLSGLVAVAVLFSGCSNVARIARGKPLKNLSVNQIIEGYQSNAPEWDWLGMKLDVQVKGAGQSDSFKASVRLARDSAIWMSISPALGVEVARILLTPDTVMFISKIPHTHACFHTHKHLCMAVCAHTLMRTQMHAHTCTHVYARVRTHASAQVNTH